MILEAIDEAVRAGARLEKACESTGLSLRTVQRWRRGPKEDLRCGPRTAPPNKLTVKERRKVLEILDAPAFRDLSPKQIVPQLADRGQYVASESTMYRILRAEGQLEHRERSKPRAHHRPTPHVATGPDQLWSWDITYLKSCIRGCFYYLYMVEDVWSRKIVAWEVHETEDARLAAELVRSSCELAGIDPKGLVLHSDNGGPMKGSTMLATLQRLGIVPSFSRPSVSDDNPYSESLFRTMKYRPAYPARPFESLAHARAWVAAFVAWYNTEHLHSGIGFVTPADRHAGHDQEILRHRRLVYDRARKRHPERWSRGARPWIWTAEVHLNPEKPAMRDVSYDALAPAA